jgi:polyphosphate kinase
MAQVVSSLAQQSNQADGRLEQPRLYLNRELSSVAFIQRALDEADPARRPLLECVRFLGIVSSLLDEFCMIRLAGLQDQVVAQVTDVGPDGLLAGEQIAALRPQIASILRLQLERLREVLPLLAQRGVQVLDYEQITQAQQRTMAKYFREEIFPVLTPLGVDPGHPFPHISNRSLNLAVVLRDVEAGDLFARVKVPSTLRRLVPVPVGEARGRSSRATSRATTVHGGNNRLPRDRSTQDGERGGGRESGGWQSHAFVWLEQVIAAHLDQLFPGLEILASYPFRVLRDADFEIQQDEAGDLMETVEQGVRQRRFGSVVSLIVQTDMPEAVRALLCENLEIGGDALVAVEGPLGLGDVTELLDIDRPDLKDPPLSPHVPPELRLGRDPFVAIQRGDLLLHHPYDAFSSVAEFILAAARDPNVLAIKQTLYRVGANSRIVDALLEANDHGKQVAVLVELKARFDEEHNIEWARTLEGAGVHVVYGEVDLKTHAKVALVVRREGDGLRRYVHLGTVNYNASTARTYEDFALLTCRPELGADASNLFNALTGYARGMHYNKLLVAPNTMRTGLLARIEREIEVQRAGGRGRLIFKCNALVDPEMIRALYRASQAGVQVDLLVRSICCLRPGLSGISDNIRVFSLVGRFLEHSRIYYFGNDDDGRGERDELYLGSADLMQRNLDRRVEVLFPVEDRALRGYLRDDVLPQYLRDTVNARVLESDGTYRRRTVDGEEPFDVQAFFARSVGPRAVEVAPSLLRPRLPHTAP